MAKAKAVGDQVSLPVWDLRGLTGEQPMTSREMYLQFKESEPAVKAAAAEAGFKLGEQLTLDDVDFDQSGLNFLAVIPSPAPCASCGKPVHESPPVILWKNEGRLAAILHKKCFE